MCQNTRWSIRISSNYTILVDRQLYWLINFFHWFHYCTQTFQCDDFRKCLSQTRKAIMTSQFNFHTKSKGWCERPQDSSSSLFDWLFRISLDANCISLTISWLFVDLIVWRASLLLWIASTSKAVPTFIPPTTSQSRLIYYTWYF